MLSLPVALAAGRAAQAVGVSRVARSRRGFLYAYAHGALDDIWKRRRKAFVARHMAQVRYHGEPLWRDGAPTRRHLALAVWAYSPHPARLRRWLRAAGLLK